MVSDDKVEFEMIPIASQLSIMLGPSALLRDVG